MDLLITNARVWDDRPPVDIGIEGERIAAIEPRIEAAAGRVIDAEGRAVLPGFVEPHLHLDKALLHRRQPARDGTLAEAIRLTGQLKAEQDRDDVLERSRAVLDMAVAHGTVAIRAFPQEGIVKAAGTLELMEEALRMGASVVGGCPYNEPSWDDTRRHIDLVFDLAQRFDVPVDMHADFADDATERRYAAAGYIADRAIELGWQGRVSLGHVTSLGALTREEAMPVVERLRDAQVTIVTLPATDLYLGGRGDERNQRRGLTPVHLLRDAGVNVTFSSNNVRNAFTPFGKADMLQIGNLLAHAAQFGTPHGQAEVLRMATYDAARSIGLGDYGLAEGRRADVVVLDSPLVADVLADIPPRLWVVKRGRVTVESRHETIIHRTAAVPGA
jgi:cytosine deaminase